jgi:hypothetical protein
MKLTPVILISALWALAAFPARGEEAALIPEKNLRLSLAPAFGFQVQEWDGMEGGKVKLFNTGMGAEYGVKDWLSAQALWIPGANLWSGTEDGSSYGYFNDMFLGGKAGIIGDTGLIRRDDMRLAAAVGIKAPLPAKPDSGREGDLHLWGSALRVYYDYIFTPFFYLNGYLEGVYYPEQWANQRAYSSRVVYHPLEITLELDSRFRYALEGPGMELHWGLPLAYSAAPWINRNGQGPEQEAQHRFSLGLFFTASFVRMAYPFDLTLKYLAPLAGKNDQPVQRIILTGRVNFPLGLSR